MTSKCDCCDCDPGIRLCPMAERLWKQANVIYETEGYDVWLKSPTLANYYAHIAAIPKLNNTQRPRSS